MLRVFDWPHSQTVCHVNRKLKGRSLPKYIVVTATGGENEIAK